MSGVLYEHHGWQKGAEKMPAAPLSCPLLAFVSNQRPMSVHYITVLYPVLPPASASPDTHTTTTALPIYEHAGGQPAAGRAFPEGGRQVRSAAGAVNARYLCDAHRTALHCCSTVQAQATASKNTHSAKLFFPLLAADQ